MRSRSQQNAARAKRSPKHQKREPAGMESLRIHVRRVHDLPPAEDGAHVLVDRARLMVLAELAEHTIHLPSPPRLPARHRSRPAGKGRGAGCPAEE